MLLLNGNLLIFPQISRLLFFLLSVYYFRPLKETQSVSMFEVLLLLGLLLSPLIFFDYPTLFSILVLSSSPCLFLSAQIQSMREESGDIFPGGYIILTLRLCMAKVWNDIKICDLGGRYSWPGVSGNLKVKSEIFGPNSCCSSREMHRL